MASPDLSIDSTDSMKIATDMPLKSLWMDERAASEISSMLVSVVLPPVKVANVVRWPITVLIDSPSDEGDTFGFRA